MIKEVIFCYVNIREGLLHARVGQGEPLLQEVRAQHGLQRERRTTFLAFGVVRGDEFDQSYPRHDFVHLLQELALTGFLGAQIEVQCDWLNAIYFIVNTLFCQHIFLGIMQISIR